MAGFIALFLGLGWKHNNDLDALVVDLLFYAGIAGLLWRKRERLSLEADAISTTAGLLLAAWVLFKSLSLFSFESLFLKLAPLPAFVAVALLASGFKGLRHYRRELLVLCLMIVPVKQFWSTGENVFNLEFATAKFAGFLLHYLGFDTAQEGAVVILPVGAVEVSVACSSVPMILLLLKLALLVVIVVPLRVPARIGLPLAALATGFVLGGVRVAVMAAVAADRTRFDYWHGPAGTQFFSTLAVVVFFALCAFIARQQQGKVAAHE